MLECNKKCKCNKKI